MEEAAVVIAVRPRTGQGHAFGEAAGLTKESLLKILKKAKHEGSPNHLSYIVRIHSTSFGAQLRSKFVVLASHMAHYHKC